MKVAVIQHDIVWENAEATRSALEPRVATAASAGARLVVLTEMFATGFSMHPERIAEPQCGPTETWLVERAHEHGIWIVGSIAQQVDGEDDRAVNVAVLAAPTGERYRYEKIHPFTYAGEHEHYRPGGTPLVVDVEGLRTAVFICYDLRFADEFWEIADEVDCYVVVANWPTPRREHWRALLRARAIENQAYVVGANRVGGAGRYRDLDHSGDSVIVDPLGRVLAEASVVETTLLADLDAEQVTFARTEFPFLADRRGR
jgi:predicted amidohydrolase